MKQFKYMVACVTLLPLLSACESQQGDNAAQERVAPREVPAAGKTVDIIARGLSFDAPDVISSGWNTFRFTNESSMVHFAVLERLPDGISLGDQQSEVAPIFQQGMDLLNAGDTEAAMAKFGELPAWFGDIVFIGGPGFLSPGQTAEAAVFVEPGTYLIECYVKTNGVFHSYSADPEIVPMVHQLEVTGERTNNTAPSANMEIRVSSESGFEISGTPKVGKNTVAVHFVDQIVHENFVGHDVHIAMVPDNFSADELVTWMNWTESTGLETPSPVKFLGGLNEMPAGTTGYFSVNLEPATYVWVAEVPGADKKGMFETFTVSP